MNMRDKIIEVISESTPFSAHEIGVALKLYDSYDIVIRACEVAASMGISLERACKIVAIEDFEK